MALHDYYNNFEPSSRTMVENRPLKEIKTNIKQISAFFIRALYRPQTYSGSRLSD